jgi:endonuclease/exonuclease/phosphatase family metal-dependent hydrolase
LRAGVDGEPVRRRQARLIHHWIGEAIRRGENFILLGDMNSEERGDAVRAQSDMGIAAGRETSAADDDLVDLTLRISRQDRQTHLLEDRQFDRILVSRSLVEDDPRRPDLVFRDIRVASDLAVRGTPDAPEDHWDRYWKIPIDERDLSDHFPVIATFDVR